MQLLSDNPSHNNDLLGFNGMASIIEILIRELPEPPFTIGIFGEWGCGKTTLMRMIEARLNSRNEGSLHKEKVKTVWFNAWKYDSKEIIWNALIQQIFYSMIKDLEEQPNPDNKNLKGLISKTSEQMAKYADLTRPAGTIMPPATTRDALSEMPLHSLKALSANDEEFEFINKFEKKFDEIVTQYVGGKDKYLVVFIDDLDRCLPENAIAVMEALKLYLDRGNCIFVIGTERSIIEEGIKQRYKDNKWLSGKEYLEKIIQLPFIMRGIEPKEALILLQPYEKTLDYRDIRLRTVITEGTKCNPRRIKRFANTFCVLSAIANYLPNGGGQAKLPIEEQQHLAKILLIQMRFPDFYAELVKNIELIAELTEVLSLKPNQQQGFLAHKSETFKEFFENQEIADFLINTSDIPCKKEDIRKWVLLTKGQSIGA